MAMYGIEFANPPENSIKKLVTAVLGSFSKRQHDRKVNMTFDANQRNGRDLDPAMRICRERVLQFRRAMERRPDIRRAAEGIWRRYKNENPLYGVAPQPIQMSAAGRRISTP